MGEFQIGSETYRVRRLCAYDQWKLLRKVTPILPALTGMEYGLRLPGIDLGNVTTFLAPLAQASDEDLDAVFAACRGGCERKDGEVWVEATGNLGLSDLISLVMQVVSENFGPMFDMARPDFTPTSSDGPEFRPVSMPDGEDWLWRPVDRGYCRMEGLFDGTLRIEQIAMANDALNVRDENETLARKAAEKKK